MTPTPKTISWVTPPCRPQWYPVDLHRKRDPLVPSTVNDSWATQPYVLPPCDKMACRTCNIHSLSDIANPPPCQPQPRRSDRKYRPWSWEFEGARFWPWLDVKQYVGEELRLRHDRKMPHRRPHWPPEIAAKPALYAVDHYQPTCVVPVREMCCAERPMSCPRPLSPLTYANFANWQWIP